MIITRQTLTLVLAAVAMSCGIQWKAYGDGSQAATDATCPIAFPASDYCADLQWLVYPSSFETKGEALIRFWKKGSLPERGQFSDVPGKNFLMSTFMPDHHHGGRKVLLVPMKNVSDQVIPGVYRASNLIFFMAGKWDVRLQLKDAKNPSLEPEQASLSFEVAE